MAALSDDVKRFIVMALACFDTPSQVAAAVKEEFGVTVPRQQCELYDPTRRAGKELSRKWRTLFEETRSTWRVSAAMVPIANRVHRLRVLDQLVKEAERRQNYGLALQILEQAAKEVGNMFVRLGRVSGTGATDGQGDEPVATRVVRGVKAATIEDYVLLEPDESVPDVPVL